MNCELCAVGSYKTGTNEQIMCAECQEGKYGAEAIAQSSSSHCTRCPAGYYGPIASATECKPCPAGE
jgi:hypothetical protein